MRISEFCGLTISDVDLKKRMIHIDHQLIRTSKMEYKVEPPKSNAGVRDIPMSDEVYACFKRIIDARPKLKIEPMFDGKAGFLYLDKNGRPKVALHWEKYFNHMVHKYNDIYKVQIPNITPHVCRHTYCSHCASAGMNPKHLQYLMGHADIGVTMDTYTHVELDDVIEGVKETGKKMAL